MASIEQGTFRSCFEPTSDDRPAILGKTVFFPYLTAHKRDPSSFEGIGISLSCDNKFQEILAERVGFEPTCP